MSFRIQYQQNSLEATDSLSLMCHDWTPVLTLDMPDLINIHFVQGHLHHISWKGFKFGNLLTNIISFLIF